MHASQPAQPSKRLLLPDGPPSIALGEAFAGILAYAAAQAVRPVGEAEQAVHEFRKSVRRARAIVKLVRDSMPGATYRALNGDLRDAVAATSGLRDVDMLLGQVIALPDQPRLRGIQAGLREHLVARRATLHGSCTTDALLAGQHKLKPLLSRFTAGLSLELTTEDLEVALAKSFRRARKALRAAETERPGTFIALHSFRKRVKELRYQLELLRPRVRNLEPLRALANMAKGLGEIMDTVVLRDYVHAHASELAVAATPLLQRLEDRAGARRDKVLRRAMAFFELKAGVFAAMRRTTGPRS